MSPGTERSGGTEGADPSRGAAEAARPRGSGKDGGPAGRVDLHLHSTASDGTVRPAEVVREAAERGVAGLSLTDHDTVAGIEEAAAESKRRGLAFLVGAELSANEPGRSVHLLAYGFDPSDARLLRFMEAYTEDRVRRARRIVERLNEIGVSLSYEDVEAEAGLAAPTRAHVARALLRRGAAASHDRVFRRWLSRGRPAFVEKRATPPREVIRRVHEAGGVAVLAHPGRTYGAADVRRWVGEGLDGVEVLHPENSPAVRRSMDALARELGLLRAGGSDWHGPDTHRAPIGSEPVPAAWMDAIAARTRAGV